MTEIQENIRNNLRTPDTMKPYKLAAMMKAAYQIIDKLVNIPTWLMSYDDIEFILQLVMDAVKKARTDSERAER